MFGAVFIETLRRAWKLMLLWGFGLGMLGLLTMLILPAFDAAQIGDMLRTMPPFVLQMVGVGQDFEFAITPTGLLAVGFFGKFALFFVVYPVVMGLSVTANDEDEGILDMVLTLPAARARVLLERFAAYSLTLIGLAALIFAGLWAGLQFTAAPIDIGRMAVSALNLLPMLFFILAFTTFVGAAARRRALALGIVTAFIGASFMLDTVGGMAAGSPAESLRSLSFFAYYDATQVMQDGFSAVRSGALVALAVALVGGALWLFERRDIGV